MATFKDVIDLLKQTHGKINATQLAREFKSLHEMIEELQEEHLGLQERVRELERQIKSPKS